jgi:very-short-patch-repair endonuclease
LTPVARGMAASRLESRFLLLWRVAQGPPLEREVRFHTSLRWRADFAHMGSRTLIEIEGGIFIPGGGRHNRGGGYAKDSEKYLEAVLAGWTVIRLTEKQLEVDFIERIVALLRQSFSSAETASGRNRRTE